jgi:Protein of unknown function (DUF1810)
MSWPPKLAVYASGPITGACAQSSSRERWIAFVPCGNIRRAIERASQDPYQLQRFVTAQVLGPRLIECTRILTELSGRTAQDIFGGIDAIKLRSSMTLFAHAAGG